MVRRIVAAGKGPPLLAPPPRRQERFKSATVADLPIAHRALYILASPSTPEAATRLRRSRLAQARRTGRLLIGPLQMMAYDIKRGDIYPDWHRLQPHIDGGLVASWRSECHGQGRPAYFAVEAMSSGWCPVMIRVEIPPGRVLASEGVRAVRGLSSSAWRPFEWPGPEVDAVAAGWWMFPKEAEAALGVLRDIVEDYTVADWGVP